MNKKTKKLLLCVQRDEIESLEIYTLLAKKQKSHYNRDILAGIAKDEQRHYTGLKNITGKDIRARKWRVYLYVVMARVLGITFALKLMENGEFQAQITYQKLEKKYPEVHKILQDEEKHERGLIDMLREEKLGYMGSVVLGLNDALVELTGALAGFTFAIQNSRSIALIGLITGISASFSMAASEFLSQRQEGAWSSKKALISSAYTGIAYIITVILLVLPYLLMSHAFHALWYTICIAISIIAIFNFYISVAKDFSFKERFFEMVAISLGVASISFLVGWFVKTFLWLDV